MSWGYNNTESVEGKKVTGVQMTHDDLWFHFDDGTTAHFWVEGDCCSHSYFYDFSGLEKLIANGPVIELSHVDLGEPTDKDAERGDVVKAYGFRLVTESPEWGDQTTVLSFRNDSNGYYGGWMVEGDKPAPADLPIHTSDFTVSDLS